jgi:hypothetical protein
LILEFCKQINILRTNIKKISFLVSSGFSIFFWQSAAISKLHPLQQILDEKNPSLLADPQID